MSFLRCGRRLKRLQKIRFAINLRWGDGCTSIALCSQGKSCITESTTQRVFFPYQEMHPVDQVKKAELFRPEAAKKLPILKQEGSLLTRMAFVLPPIIPEALAY